MNILFTCTGCGAKYNVPAALGGKKAQCKKCGVVTRIPAPAPPPTSGELSFRDEAPEPSLSTETVAGTVHAMDTSSRVVDDDLYDPAPIFDTAPAPAKRGGLLGALPKVGMSELDALDFKSPSRGGPGGARGSAIGNYAPDERYSLLFLLLFVGAVGFGIYHDYQVWPSLLTPVNPAYTTVGGQPHAMLLVPRLILLVSAFAVLAPLVMLGWFAGCRAMNMRLPSGLYMRSLGIAVLPIAAIILLTSLPLDMTVATAGTVSVICVPIAFALLVYVHRQGVNASGITTGVSAILVIFGLVFTFMGASAVQETMRGTYERKRDAIVQQKIDEKVQKDLALKEEERQKALAASAAAATKPTVASEAATKEAAALLTRLKGMEDKSALATQTRESLTEALDAAESELAVEKKAFATLPSYGPIAEAITSLRQTVLTLPSEKPPADLTQPVANGADWSAKSGRKEISVFSYNFVPPADAVVVLNTDGQANAWRWKSADGQTQLTIQSTPAPAPDQKRPWIAPLAITQHAKIPTFAVDASPDAVIDTGVIASQPFTRITEAPAAGAMGVRKATYVTRADNQWITATIQGTPQSGTGFGEMERAVGTLHKRPDAVGVTDPLSASELASRYKTAKGDEADVIAKLLKGKPGAEDAVLRAIGVAPDANALQQFGPLLASVASAHAVPTLWKIAPMECAASDSARTALRTLDPKNSDDLSFAIMDLKSGHPSQVKSALSTLATIDVQKSRLQEVGRILQPLMQDRGFVASASPNDLVATLGKWMNDDIAKGLVAMLDSSTSSDRQLAIKSLAATGNKRWIFALTKCVSKEPDLLMDTLITMGPVAEPDVDRLLSDKDAIARKSGAMILQEIGTQKSLTSLQSAIGQSGDPEFKNAANEAMTRIKDRMKTATPAAK